MVYSLTFAPVPLPQWALPAVQIVVLAWLARACLHAPNRTHAAWQGWFFGMGAFAVGLYWLTISMSRYGGMPWILSVVALLALSAYLALFPALALWLTHHCKRSGSTILWLGVWAGTWTLTEWLRGTLFTGFPWLNMAYGQVDSWLAGWSVLLGSYGVVAMTAFVAAALALTFDPQHVVSRLEKKALPLMAITVVVLGALVGAMTFSQPYESPLRVRLIQGNIDQAEKFTPAQWQQAIQRYIELAQHRITSDPTQTPTPQLIMMPETVMIKFPHDVPASVWQTLIDLAQRDQATFLLGTPLLDPPTRQYSNSVIQITAHTTSASIVANQVPRYDKHHLVPFGEYVPLGFRWFVDLMHIPLGDFTAGTLSQRPFTVQDQRIAAHICYEDIFGQEINQGVHQGATILANFSNLGWFGDTWALRQHWQMARMRAMETARPIIRATNTGMTGAIDHKGRNIAYLRPAQGAYLDVSVQGQTGLTPYVQWGNLPVLCLAGVIVLLGVFKSRQKQ